MDGFFVLIAIFGIVNMVIKWAKKQQASQNSSNQGAAPDKPWQRMMGDMARTFEESVTGKPPVKAAPPAPAKKTPASSIYGEGMGGEGLAAPGSMTYQRPASYITGGDEAGSPYALAGEGMYRPLEPVQNWRGSLAGASEPIAFTTKMRESSAAAEPGQERHPALGLPFNRDSLMQAVVMHEILIRPQDRRRRWRAH